MFKSEVYQLLDYFKEQGVLTEELIDRVPSAGLFSGQTDEGELGFSYNEMERAVKFYQGVELGCYGVELMSTQETQKIYDFVKQRHEANKHKSEVPKVIPLRQFVE